MPRQCHRLVAETAKALAETCTQQILRDNTLYANYKAMCPDLTPRRLELRMRAQLWPLLVEEARATLSRLLSQPISEVLKAEILQALIDDNIPRQARLPEQRAEIAKLVQDPSWLPKRPTRPDASGKEQIK